MLRRTRKPSSRDLNRLAPRSWKPWLCLPQFKHSQPQKEKLFASVEMSGSLKASAYMLHAPALRELCKGGCGNEGKWWKSCWVKLQCSDLNLPSHARKQLTSFKPRREGSRVLFVKAFRRVSLLLCSRVSQIKKLFRRDHFTRGSLFASFFRFVWNSSLIQHDRENENKTEQQNFFIFFPSHILAWGRGRKSFLFGS
jgi:hypothetical protein